MKMCIAGGFLSLIFINLPAFLPAQGISVLNPGKFLYTINDSCHISVTEPFKNVPQVSLRDTSSILQLKFYSPNGYDYNLGDRVEKSTIHMGTLKDGTYVIILHKRNGPITLKEEEVKKFIETYKPANAAELLATTGSREMTINLQENCKTIIQSGTYFTENCSSPTTLPLDIVPDRNLYIGDTKPQKINFTLFYKGEPLPNATISLVYKKDDVAAPVVQKLTTNKNGKAKAVINHSGTYLMSLVILNKPSAPEQAAWTGYATNLFWGYME